MRHQSNLETRGDSDGYNTYGLLFKEAMPGMMVSELASFLGGGRELEAWVRRDPSSIEWGNRRCLKDRWR